MKKILAALFLVCVFPLFADGDDIPPRPDPPRLVNDFAGIMSSQEAQSLEDKLVAFSRQTSNQIAVVTISSLGNYEISDFSFKLGKKWGIGKEDLRNGVLIVIKPKTATERGEAFIATGKGLEGAIPDATCHQIVNREMIPKFKQNDYYGGLDAATTVLMSLAKGEYNFQDYQKKKDNDRFPFFLIIFIFIIIVMIFRRRNRGYTINRRGYGGGWPWWGGFGGGGGWGGGSSGGGGGGFGGFGGGDFGGGGAGGSW
jgi:uncharacterized protein